jgi:hypothetical protein
MVVLDTLNEILRFAGIAADNTMSNGRCVDVSRVHQVKCLFQPTVLPPIQKDVTSEFGHAQNCASQLASASEI